MRGRLENWAAKIEIGGRIDKRLINKRGMSKLELVIDESAFSSSFVA